MSSSKKFQINDLIKLHDYSCKENYINHKTKLIVICNKCTNQREILPKSFIKNPTCNNCSKISKNELEKKNKINKMNINLRTKAKKIGFKITDWFRESPNKITIYCRTCNTGYERSVRSIKNGLICFNCKQNKSSLNKDENIELLNISSLVNDYILNSNNNKELNKIEFIAISNFKTILKKSNLILNDYNEENDIFLSNKMAPIKFKQQLHTKKYLLGNSFKKTIPLFMNELDLSISKNTSIKQIELIYTLPFFYSKIYQFLLKKFNDFSEEETIELTNKIFPKYKLIYYNKKDDIINTKIYHFDTPITSKKAIIQDDKLVLIFNKNIKMQLQIRPAQNKDFFSSWDNLFHEVWTQLA